MPSLVDPVFSPGQLLESGQPTLATASGAVLRPWNRDDVQSVVDAYQDPEIQRWHARSMTHDEALQWIVEAGSVWSEEKGASWVVDLDGVVSGRMTLKFDLADACAGAGYWTCLPARGRGIATSALVAATQWAVDVGFHRVQMEHSTRNSASCRVAARAGFTAEGTRRGGALHADGWHDMHVHARVSEGSLPPGSGEVGKSQGSIP